MEGCGDLVTRWNCARRCGDRVEMRAHPLGQRFIFAASCGFPRAELLGREPDVKVCCGALTSHLKMCTLCVHTLSIVQINRSRLLDPRSWSVRASALIGVFRAFYASQLL